MDGTFLVGIKYPTGKAELIPILILSLENKAVQSWRKELTLVLLRFGICLLSS